MYSLTCKTPFILASLQSILECVLLTAPKTILRHTLLASNILSYFLNFALVVSVLYSSVHHHSPLLQM